MLAAFALGAKHACLRLDAQSNGVFRPGSTLILVKSQFRDVHFLI